jgi:hypothetical protein
MPHNFFRKRACIEARDHGEPSRAVKSAGGLYDPTREDRLGVSFLVRGIGYCFALGKIRGPEAQWYRVVVPQLH